MRCLFHRKTGHKTGHVSCKTGHKKRAGQKNPEKIPALRPLVVEGKYKERRYAIGLPSPGYFNIRFTKYPTKAPMIVPATVCQIYFAL